VVNFVDWYSERMLNNLGAEPAPYLKGVPSRAKSIAGKRAPTVVDGVY
jgi:hypothetical protein